MNRSARKVRLERRHKHAQPASLALTSLMDIFTILLFFLLVSSTNPQKMPDQRFLVLPKSTAEELPKETVTILVNEENIVVEGVAIARTPDIASSDTTIPALREELLIRASRAPAPLNEEGLPEREVTILMDRKVPYQVLKRIMATCTDTEYSKISFAVLKTDGKKGSSS